MESALLSESLRCIAPDAAILEAVKINLRSEVASWISIELLSSVKIDDGTTLAFTVMKKDLNGSLLVLMTVISAAASPPSLFLGLLSASVLCGEFVTAHDQQLFAIGDADGSVTLFSCTQQRTKLAELDCNDFQRRPALKIIYQPCLSEVNVVSFWVAYPDSIEQISCNIVDGSVSKFVRTVSLKYCENEFGTFDRFQMLDSRYGKDCFLALHFRKKGCAIIVPLNVMYTQLLGEKARINGFCQEKSLDISASLHIQAPKGMSTTHSAVHPSSVRTWSVSAPVHASAECDLKTLLCSFSFKASAVMGNGVVVTGNFTTAEQRIVDTIAEIGVDAFLHPDSVVSFSHSKNIPEGEMGTVLLYQRSSIRDEITAISESNITLSDHEKRKKWSGITLWCACFEFDMFSIGRIEGVRQLGLGLFEEGGGDRDRGSKHDSDSERTQRMIVMECALAAGLGSVLSEYVLAQADTSNSLSKDFLLTDVGSVFVWTEGLYRHTAEQAFLLTEEMVVPYLVHRGSCSDGAGDDADVMTFDQLIIAANTSELVSHIAVLDSAALLFKALSARKISSFAAFGGGRDRAMNREALDEHEATLDLLSGQLAEVRALLGVLRTVLLLLRLPALQLSCVGYDSPSDLSLAQMRVERLEKAEDMTFVSDCIRSDDLLLDLLVDRTHSQVKETATLPKGDPNRSRGEPLDPEFYTALASFLWLPLLSVRAERKKAGSIGGNSDRNITAAHSVVLYALLDALSISDVSGGAESSERRKSLCSCVGDAFAMPPRDRILLYALWRVDSRIEVQGAVDDLCSSSVQLYQDTPLFLAVVRRLLSFGARREVKELLTHSTHRSALMRSETGILALTAASVGKDVWEFAWHIARRTCKTLTASQSTDGTIIPRDLVISSAKRAVCEMLCRWALLQGELGSFLESVMDDEEQEVVLSILKSLAQKEIAIAMAPAPCVDCLVLWLAENRRAREALEIHEAHIMSVRSLPPQQLNPELLGSLNMRKALLQNYLTFPPIPHRVLRDIRGRILENPLHAQRQHTVPTNSYHADPQQSDYMNDDAEEVAEEAEEEEREEEEDFEMDIPQPSVMSDEDYPDSPNIDAIARTPLTSKKERAFSSSYTDEDDRNDLSFATAARGPWSSMKKSSAYSDEQEESFGPWPDKHSHPLPVPSTPITPFRNSVEELFSPPARSSQQQQPYSLPFNSSAKKIGFLTGDAKSTVNSIREVFQDMTESFSPVDFSASAGRLPIRRKVRFSEG